MKKIEKSLTMPKKTERKILWSSPVLYVTRETFLVQFLGPTRTIWRHLKSFCRTFGVELFWSLQAYRKNNDEKKLTKRHDYSRLFSLEKSRLKKVIYLDVMFSSKDTKLRCFH